MRKLIKETLKGAEFTYEGHFLPHFDKAQWGKWSITQKNVAIREKLQKDPGFVAKVLG